MFQTDNKSVVTQKKKKECLEIFIPSIQKYETTIVKNRLQNTDIQIAFCFYKS